MIVGNVKASDLDERGTQKVSYFLLTPTSLLSIDPSSGLIKNNLLNSDIEIGVLAVDHGYPTLSSLVKVKILVKNRTDFPNLNKSINFSIPVTLQPGEKFLNLSKCYDSTKNNFRLISANENFKITDEHLSLVGKKSLLELFGQVLLLEIEVTDKNFNLSKNTLKVRLTI